MTTFYTSKKQIRRMKGGAFANPESEMYGAYLDVASSKKEATPLSGPTGGGTRLTIRGVALCTRLAAIRCRFGDAVVVPNTTSCADSHDADDAAPWELRDLPAPGARWRVPTARRPSLLLVVRPPLVDVAERVVRLVEARRRRRRARRLATVRVHDPDHPLVSAGEGLRIADRC